MNAKKLRKRFVRMGEDVAYCGNEYCNAYLAAATPKLRQAQREVAAAESALHSLEQAKPKPEPEQAHG